MFKVSNTLEEQKLQNLFFLQGFLIMINYFSRLYNNQNKCYISEYNTRIRQLKYPQYFLATLNMKVDVMLLPT